MPEPTSPLPHDASTAPADASSTTPAGDADDASATPRWYRNRRYLGAFGLSALTLLVLASTGLFDSLAQTLLMRLTPREPALVATPPAEVSRAAARPLTFRRLGLHPDVLYETYFTSPMLGDGAAPAVRVTTQFRDLLELYRLRAGVDDNFTLRVLDNRSMEVLEIRELTADRLAYERTGVADWGDIDARRRAETRRLVRKWRDRGVPKKAISVKWGRANQMKEARRREAPFIEYEMQLARQLGLSLLATEIGTVETFNQDELVSPVGARSRYQMMPYVLRQNGIRHYNLRTGIGGRVAVLEELHPLLTMEPAFLTLRGYVNAVGHEIPGISSYHSGPGNLYKVFRLFLLSDDALYTPESTVMDAYMWAVTEGFEEVSRKSTFRDFSRGYVPSAYGALRAQDEVPIDTSLTMRVEQVQLKPGQELFLSNLLISLGKEEDLDWHLVDAEAGLYERFRYLNPHMLLPAPDDLASHSVPAQGDIRLAREAEGASVRFFLPPGAAHRLAASGLDVFDASATVRFDRSTFAPPAPSEITRWDRAYETLVVDIRRFGFSEENLEQLRDLVDRFEALAEAHPTRYRLAQLKIIKTHRLFWGSAPWYELAEVAAAVTGTYRAPIRPPEQVAPLQNIPALRHAGHSLDERLGERLGQQPRW